MKVSSKALPQPVPEFKPFTLILDIETMEQAAQLFSVFNHGDVTDTMPALPSTAIRDAIKTYTQGMPYLTYRPHWERLHEKFRGK